MLANAAGRTFRSDSRGQKLKAEPFETSENRDNRLFSRVRQWIQERYWVLGLALLLGCHSVVRPAPEEPSRKREFTWRIVEAQAFDRDLTFRTVYFVDTQDGWVAGSHGMLLRTENSGSTWQSGWSPQSSWAFSSIYFADRDRGWLVGGEHTAAVLSTQNGGRTWERQFRGDPGRLNSIGASPAGEIWAVGSGGQILRTTDGKKWLLHPSGTSSCLTDLHFVDSRIGWIVGCAGFILKTEDAGSSWVKQASGVHIDLNSVRALSEEKVFVVGAHGTLIRTDDGGGKWIRQDLGVRTDLNCIRFVGEDEGWIVGEGGTILHTDNGGQDWSREDKIIDADLLDVFFVRPNVGWAVGSDGTVLKYSVVE